MRFDLRELESDLISNKSNLLVKVAYVSCNVH
jgi:hypothetical protein